MICSRSAITPARRGWSNRLIVEDIDAATNILVACSPIFEFSQLPAVTLIYGLSLPALISAHLVRALVNSASSRHTWHIRNNHLPPFDTSVGVG